MYLTILFRILGILCLYVWCDRKTIVSDDVTPVVKYVLIEILVLADQAKSKGRAKPPSWKSGLSQGLLYKH